MYATDGQTDKWTDKAMLTAPFPMVGGIITLTYSIVYQASG